MDLSLAIATLEDVPAIVTIKNENARALTLRYGKGHWSYQCTEKGVLFDIKEIQNCLWQRITNKLLAYSGLLLKNLGLLILIILHQYNGHYILLAWMFGMVCNIMVLALS
ncbi:hypothetical protein BH10BAC2_BH10BAC2_38970 [soil metagenome]